jgi:hypothetical protein
METEMLRGKPVPESQGPSQIPHKLAWDQKLAIMLTGWHITD